MLWAVLSGIALLIILALGFYAGKLLFMLKQQKERQEAARQSRVATITESIIVIAKAMEQQQCGNTTRTNKSPNQKKNGRTANQDLK
jgi:hypothetical protein